MPDLNNVYPRATVTVDSDGTVVLHDPDAIAMIRAISAHNCRAVTLAANLDAVRRFRDRVDERGMVPRDALIVIFNGDDRLGALFAGLVMPPGWEAPHRAAGATPIARGLADRAAITEAVEQVMPDVAAKLRAISGVAVLVVDYDVPFAIAYDDLR